MKIETEILLRNVLAMDAGIDPANIERAVGYLRGERSGDDLIHVLKFKDVLALLHIHRRTLEYYLARGYLDRVYGGGKRALGVSRDSYIRFTTLRVADSHTRVNA